MIDLIEDVINDKNKSSVYCSYIGNSLGNQYEYLINVPQTKQNKWAVDKNRQMFSLSKMKESMPGNNYKHKMEERESNPSKNIGYKQLNQSNEIAISTEVSNNFMTYILKNKDEEIETIIKNLKQNYFDGSISSIEKNRLLDSMQNLGELSNKLIGLITQWSKDTNIQNNTVIENIIALKHKIISQNELNTSNKKRYSINRNPTDEIKIKKDIDINNLLLVIIGRVQKHEESKRLTMGGTKKRKSKPKKNTRRRRK